METGIVSPILKERYERMRKKKQYRTDFLTEIIPLEQIQKITQIELKKELSRYACAGGNIWVKIKIKYILEDPLGRIILNEDQPDKYERLERKIEKASKFKERIEIGRERIGEPQYGEILHISTFIPYSIKYDSNSQEVLGIEEALKELESFNEIVLSPRPVNFSHYLRYKLRLDEEDLVDINYITRDERVKKHLTEREKKFGTIDKHPYEEVFGEKDLEKLAQFYHIVSPLIVGDCRDRPVILRRLNPFGYPESIEGRYEKAGGGKRLYEIRTGKDVLRYVKNEKAISFIPETHDFERNLLECVIDKDPSRKFDFGYISWFFNDFNTYLYELGFRQYQRVTGGKGEHNIIPLSFEKPFDIILPKGTIIETHLRRRDEKSILTDSAVAATAVLTFSYKCERERKDHKTRPISTNSMDRVACLRSILFDISPMWERHGRRAVSSLHHKTGRVCIPVNEFPKSKSKLYEITQMENVVENLDEYFSMEAEMSDKKKLENFRILRDICEKYADKFTRFYGEDLTESLF